MQLMLMIQASGCSVVQNLSFITGIITRASDKLPEMTQATISELPTLRGISRAISQMPCFKLIPHAA